MIPGVGQMYLGFMKQGLSILTATCLLSFLSIWLEIGALMIFFPIIWFYSFFDAINKNSMCDEDFYALEDDYCFHLEEISALLARIIHGKQKLILAILLIFVGADILLKNFMYYLRILFGWDFVNVLEMYIGRLPQLLFALFIILVGISLIKGKKIELKQLENKEDNHENA